MTMIRYDRATLAEVVVYHHKTSIEGCLCGWSELGRSIGEHVADVYEHTVASKAAGKSGWDDQSLLREGQAKVIHPFCAHCGSAKEPNANYVDGCGWVSSTFVFCTNCGKRKEPNRNFVHDQCLCRDQPRPSPLTKPNWHADCSDQSLCASRECDLYAQIRSEDPTQPGTMDALMAGLRPTPGEAALYAPKPPPTVEERLSALERAVQALQQRPSPYDVIG